MNKASHPKIFLPLLLALGLLLGPLLRGQETPPATPADPEEKTAAAPPPAAAPASEQKAEAAPPAPAAPETAPEPEPKPDAKEESRGKRHRHQVNERVSFGSDSKLAADEEAQAVVSILGSSTSAGKVHDAVVSILGSSRVTGGTVGNAVVSVLGNTYVNGHVQGQVVAVLGNVELGPDAVVEGEIVCVGGQLKRDAKAVHRGTTQNIALAGMHFDFSPLVAWFSECALLGRPLAFDGRLLWAWAVAGCFLGFYMLVALIAPAGVVKCAETFEQRPGASLLAALLTLLLTPVAYVLMVLTIAIVIGLVLIPAFSLGMLFAALFGKIVMLAWLGRRFTRLLGDGPLAHPVFGVLIGGLIVMLLYTIPVVGFITYKLLGSLGLGVVVYTLILHFKTSRPPKPASVATAVATAGVAATAPAAPGEAPPVMPVVSAAPPVISAATLPRAGFWLRVAAAILDAILVGIIFGLLDGLFSWLGKLGGSFPLWFAVYHVVMWATKGTTIGGIICGLKVVRMDDRPLDWTVAVVRALSAFLSLAVAGLGFIWAAFDDDKQSWHDKIAGTTIVKVPKGTALL